MKLEDFNELVHAIYRAGIQPLSWPDVVKTLSNLFSGTVISLQAHSVVAEASLGLLTSEEDTDFLRTYEQHYAATNVWMPCMSVLPAGRAFYSEEFYSRRDLVKTEFYHDYLKGKDFVAASGLVLERTRKNLLFLSATLNHREAEHLPQAIVEIFNLIGPHILRSFELMRQIPNIKPGENYCSTLESGKEGLFFLDRRGHVVHANGAANAFILAGTSVSFQRNGRLEMFDPKADLALQRALKKITNEDHLGFNGDFKVCRRDAGPLKANIVPLEHRIAQTSSTRFSKTFRLPCWYCEIVPLRIEQHRFGNLD